jgi:hypothetical protein
MSLIKRLFLETINQDRIEIDKEYYERMNQIKYYNYEHEEYDQITVRGATYRKETLSMDRKKYNKYNTKSKSFS